jgi:hypothetical protein
MVNSHLDGWNTTTLTKTQAILNIIRMEDLYDPHDCKAKKNYPYSNPNPEGKIGIQLKECMQ